MSPTPTEFCLNIFTEFPVHRVSRSGQIGVFMFLSGLIYLFTSAIILSWIKRQQALARQGDAEAVKSVIFPAYVTILWFNLAVNVIFGLVMINVESPEVDSLPPTAAATYSFLWAVQHFVIEGIAFLFMQKGLGEYAVRRALTFAFAWAVFSGIVEYFTLLTERNAFTTTINGIWELAMLFFYLALWKCPQKYLYRRPAAILYSELWFFYRVFAITTEVLRRWPQTDAVGTCSNAFVRFYIFALMQPWLTYTSLLRDSMFVNNA